MVPEGWERHPIGKLCKSIVPGRNKPTTFNGNIPWITTPDIQGRYIPSKVQNNYVSEPAIKEAGAKIIPAGSVVISAVGDLGLTAIATEPVVLNQQLHAFVCPDFINNEYLAYWLETQKPYMNNVASKTTIPYMNKANCESIPVAYPPLPEQNKIACILSTWDKAIETVEKLIENSKAQKKALMQQLLTGKRRLPGFDGGWKDYHLMDVTNILVSPVDKKTIEGEKPVLLCNYTDVYYNTRIRKSLNFMQATATDREINKFTLTVGDVLITKDSETPGDIAVPAYVSEDLGGVVCGYHLAILRPKKGIVDGEFLSYLLSLEKTRYYFFTLATGATRFGLSVGSIEKALLNLPPLKEQQEIAIVITTADKEIETLQQKLDFLNQEKKALMQQLLTGKRRVKVESEDKAYA